jgi:hypothetical protein
MITTPIGVAVVGFGYWGPNVVRNIAERPELRLLGLCERDPARADEFSRRYPGVRVESGSTPCCSIRGAGEGRRHPPARTMSQGQALSRQACALVRSRSPPVAEAEELIVPSPTAKTGCDAGHTQSTGPQSTRCAS